MTVLSKLTDPRANANLSPRLLHSREHRIVIAYDLLGNEDRISKSPIATSGFDG